MKSPHLIDSVVFDTRYSKEVVGQGRQSVIEDFIKTQLLEVIDEVFENVSNKSDQSFRVDNIEIDLGKIPSRDFKQQMPGKLRERLKLALSKARYSASEKSSTQSSVADAKRAEWEQLLFFLNNGFLPWYSRNVDNATIESWLIEVLKDSQEEFIRFLNGSSQHTRVIERIFKQFSSAVLQGIVRALPLLNVTDKESMDGFEETETSLLSAVLSKDSLLIESLWQQFYSQSPSMLEIMIRHHGQQYIVRQGIAESFTSALFHKLLLLLEPEAAVFVQETIELIFELKDELPAISRSSLIIRLRTLTLSYLLVEQGNQFDKKTFLHSLLRQLDRSEKRVLSNFFLINLRKQASKQSREIGQLLDELSAEIPSLLSESSVSSLQEPDQPVTKTGTGIVKQEKITSIESKNAEDVQKKSHDLIAMISSKKVDQQTKILSLIKTQSQESPELLKPLCREILDNNQDWNRISLAVLVELTRALVSSNSQQMKAGEFHPGEDLLTTIASHADKVIGTDDRKSFYLKILGCLVSNRPIDFDHLIFEQPSGIHDFDTSERLIQAENIEMKFDKETDYQEEVQREEIRQEEVFLNNAMAGAVDYFKDKLELSSEQVEFETDEAVEQQNIYINNAGIVLAAPHFPLLFERLGLVEQGEFRDREASERGVHCVQYLVDQSTDSPEYQLVLNKLLCGVKTGLPIRRSIELRPYEIEQLDGLLTAITQLWKALGNTSVDGLRQTFLQRDGRLHLKNDAWHLTVEPGPFDMLLDQIPWMISLINLPWMERFIYVEWR